MDSKQKKNGFTLIEMLIVLAVIVLLASLVIGLASRIDNQGKERLAKSTIALLTSALEEFRDFGYTYKHLDYTGFEFPLDCNDFPSTRGILEPTLEDALGLEPDTIAIVAVDVNSPANHQPEYSGCEAMYFFLSKVPECRQTLDQISSKLITDKDENGNRMKLLIAGESYPLLRVIDPWGITLRYDYYDELQTSPDLREQSKRAFPFISSAGPDGDFDTDDDVTNIR